MNCIHIYCDTHHVCSTNITAIRSYVTFNVIFFFFFIVINVLSRDTPAKAPDRYDMENKLNVENYQYILVLGILMRNFTK